MDAVGALARDSATPGEVSRRSSCGVVHTSPMVACNAENRWERMRFDLFRTGKDRSQWGGNIGRAEARIAAGPDERRPPSNAGDPDVDGPTARAYLCGYQLSIGLDRWAVWACSRAHAPRDSAVVIGHGDRVPQGDRPAVTRRPTMAADLTTSLVAGMILGQVLIAMRVVSRQPRHQLLRVVVLDVHQEASCGGASQRAGRPAVMRDADCAAPMDAIGETTGAVAHRAKPPPGT